ncbi:MAG: DUF1573 domain-containing protein [Flavobacteriales bacterium]|nr:DUF1573 domain-containing protein [Flavobacteriales bacterium]
MRIFFIFLCSIILNSATVFGQFAEFSFEETVHKFPKTVEGEQLSCVYSFTNTGTEPLIISSYKVECTCTKAEYSKAPIMPGESGEITVTFDTNGKIGWQYRTVSIYANTKETPTEIEFRVKVIPKE